MAHRLEGRNVFLRVLRRCWYNYWRLNKLTAQQLEQIEQLIAQGQFPDALKKITTLESSEQLIANNRSMLRYLQSTLFLKMGRFKEGLQVAEKLLEDSRKAGDPLLEFNSLINVIWALQSLGRYDEGLQLARRGEKLLKILVQAHQPGLKERQAAFLHRKGSLLRFKGELDQALILLEASLALSEEIDDKNGFNESLGELGLLYFVKTDLDRLLEYGQKLFALSEAISDRQGLTISHFLLGLYYHAKGDFDRSKEYYHKTLALSEAIGDKRGLARSLLYIGINYYARAELVQALEYCQKALAKFEIIGDQHHIALSHLVIGRVYGDKGELNQALEQQQKSLAIREVIGNLPFVAGSLMNIGCLYGQLGDFQAATEHLERALDLCQQTGYELMAAEILYQLIRFFITDLPPETVKSYLERLKEINKRIGDRPIVGQHYRLAKAIVLKVRGRLADKVAAQRIFQQIATEDMVRLELTVEALINLGELLLLELETTEYEAAFTELNVLARRLLALAKDQSSYSLLVEAYLIQSKLQLLQLNLQDASSLLTQAHLVAQEKGLDRLVQITTIEQDSLVNQSTLWKRIIAQKPSMSEIIKLTQVDNLISQMIHKRRYTNEAELLAYAENAQKLVKTWEK
jgi:tetratricopeptide (TPR) repeat protein